MHAHGSHRERPEETADRRALAASLALIGAFVVAEVVAGVIAGSLALLADAGHMLTDVAALALALIAAAMAVRPARGRWTFGYRRVEILAAQVNGITLLLVAMWIVYEAARRLASPPDVEGAIVLAVALVGIVVNLAAARLLSPSSRTSLNIRGAFLHVVTDLAAFVGTAVAGGLVLATGWDRFDPLASLLVAGLMFWSSATLLRESVGIFLESSPPGVDPAVVGGAIVERDHVVEVHDLHVWTVTSGFPSLSAHVLVERDADCHAVRRGLEQLLHDRFGLEHTTLQVDHVPAPSAPVELGDAFRRQTPLRRRG
jgi:cobalt-zinc-cadmium efflux system protein